MNRSPDAPQPKAEWRILRFEVAAVPQSDRGKRVKQRDYLPAGRIPVIDQGQAQIGGYTNNEEFAFVGDLPVVLFGDHTRAVKFVDHPFAVGADGIKVFRPREGIRPKYLYYWMKSARLPDRGYGRHYQFLRQLTVPAPPPAEQYEIVAEIEKQFSRLDEAVANLKRVKANLKRYKAAVLKAAVEGRLVPTEAELARRAARGYETGVQLLQRILDERRAQWSGPRKYKEPEPPDTDLPELAEGWVWASIEQLSSLVEYGSSTKTSDDARGVPVVRMGNIHDGALLFHDMKYLPHSHGEFPKLLLAPGDVLFNRTNSADLVGKTAVFKGAPQPCSFASYLIRARLVHGCLPPFVAAYINSSYGRQWVKSVVTQQVGQANVNGTKLQALTVPLPPGAEQARIVAEVDRRLSLVREVDAEVDTNLTRAERLRQATLQEAFAGASSAR